MLVSGIWLALWLSVGIGVILGLVGGGGSILAVPVLVYVAEIPPKEAIVISLAIVAIASSVGAILQARQRYVSWRMAYYYSLSGLPGAVIGAQFTKHVPGAILLSLFALIMGIVGFRMFRPPSAETESTSERSSPSVIASGFSVGLLTGFLGVGGGFLIVPALIRSTRMAMRRAIGTSLVVISFNSAGGFVSHLGDIGEGLSLIIPFSLAITVGMFGGIGLANKVSGARLKQAFGALCILVSIYLLLMNASESVRLLGLLLPS